MSHDELRRTYEALRDQMNATWVRDLPFDELLFDRWERAKHLGFGDGASIYHLSYVYGDVAVGEHTWIGPFTVLDGSGGLSIGDWCSISAGVQIYSHDSVLRALSGGTAAIEQAPVVIGDCCYVGPGALISKGITVGEHSVIGAQAFVNRDVEPYSIVVGTPARRVGRVQIRDGEVVLEYDSVGDVPKVD
jgi:acetyltransferase-like isoleucine patch superfamily enzyme